MTDTARIREQSLGKMNALRAAVRSCGSALVAFSAGVDSTLVLKVAFDELGTQAVALTAISPSMPDDEQREAKALAERIGARWVSVQSQELAKPGYVANSQNRCYFCKTELYDWCESTRSSLGLAAVLDGFNADDFHDHRPGHKAAREHGVRSPLADAGLTKAEVRAWSEALGLPTWDKPQMACLASRIPYGTEVTRDRLLQIGAAESDLRRLGLKQFRVRYHGEVARLEIGADEYERLFDRELRDQITRALKGQGFRFVALDLEPFRSGRMNEKLPEKSALELDPPATGWKLPVVTG